MDEKDLFLADIRKSLGYSAQDARTTQECASLFASADDAAVLERIQYRTHVEKQALLKILQENAEKINLDVQPVKSLADAATRIVEIVEKAEPEFGHTKQLIQHDDTVLAKLQLWKRFSGKAVQVHTAYAVDSQVREKSIASYVGLTAPRWAVAESATIVELGEPGRPRSTSLVPSVHIALIHLKDVLAELSEVYAMLRQQPPEHSCLFISGPSKTAEIEAHMVHGAHGPRQVHLVVVDEQLKEAEGLRGSGLFSS
ncbi:LutC/YkgG family protein [Thiohalophilus sp.]|uniref:LutC/YkgG family protein n=1 Tax=Thiohalophilus sp. TaxID=3028392 RepID=UPI002ACEE895|nr:LUD domain-containing protein [Thiohalophilus sp.]MDZ7803202.1 LUD domain-containing protein [Thiohalophilus sp.]